MLYHKDRLFLATIWSNRILIAAKRMRKAQTRLKIFTAEVVSFRLVSHSEAKAATDAQKGVYETASGGCTSKVSDYKAGMED